MRKGLGQRELERDVGPRVVAHDVGRLGSFGLAVRGQPVVHLAAVPGRVLHGPGVAGGGDLLRAGGAGVEMERQQVAAGVLRVGLMEDRLAVRAA